MLNDALEFLFFSSHNGVQARALALLAGLANFVQTNVKVDFMATIVRNNATVHNRIMRKLNVTLKPVSVIVHMSIKGVCKIIMI